MNISDLIQVFANYELTSSYQILVLYIYIDVGKKVTNLG